MYQIKRMKSARARRLVRHDLSSIAKWAIVENAQYRLLRRQLPGPYTFILDATRIEVLKVLLLKRKQVGIRVPDHPVPMALTGAFGSPIISTTAGWHGQDAFVDPHEIATEFPGVSVILDAGGGGVIPTTVVDLTGGVITVVREGAGDPDLFRNTSL